MQQYFALNAKYGYLSTSTFYLSSDGAGEPPHGFIGSVVFTSASHLKGKRHSVSFNLKHNIVKMQLYKIVCALCLYCVCLCKTAALTLTRSLGHPVPKTLRLPYPRVFPPYSVTLRLFVLGPA